MRSETDDPTACSIARALAVVGERWTLAIVREAFAGAHRFDDFRKRLGIARNILSARLRSLVEHGVFERRAYQQTPPRFEYRLTPMGNDLYPVLVSLLGWGDRWLAGDDGAPLTLTHRPCGHAAQPELTCGHCGDALRPEDVRAKLRLRAGGPSNPPGREHLDPAPSTGAQHARISHPISLRRR